MVFGPRDQKVGLRTALKRKAQSFTRDESGAVFVFALIIFILMLVFGGMAVDIARMEAQRLKVQQTVDRAVLAAADLDNTADPKEVVLDYFEKSGLGHLIDEDDIDVDESFNGKTVTAVANSRVSTMFLNMVGVESLNAVAGGAAQEQVSDIEISLVVDISGSMGWDNADGTAKKIDTMKAAASIFFDEVAEDQTEETGITMISIIPYNATVNVGEEFLDYFTATEWHTESHCVRFFDNDFYDREITRTQLLQRVANFADGEDEYKRPPWYAYWCDDDADHTILPFETDVQAMKDHMNRLAAGGMTGIDNGMKWASALIDPTVRPILNEMIDLESTDPLDRSELVRNWPTDYGTENSMKVIVLMTDGANTEQWDIKSHLKSPDGLNPTMSPVYFSPSAGASERRDGWYVRFPNNNWWERWYRPRASWKTSDDQWIRDSWVPNDLVQMSWQDLWNEFYTRDAAKYFFYYSDPDGNWWTNGYSTWWEGDLPSYYNDVRYPAHMHDGYSEGDTRLERICDEIKKEEVIIFSIAFEAPTEGQEVMQYCAHSDGHYYDVDGTDLAVAFKSIASQINHLRLIQ